MKSEDNEPIMYYAINRVVTPLWLDNVFKDSKHSRNSHLSSQFYVPQNESGKISVIRSVFGSSEDRYQRSCFVTGRIEDINKAMDQEPEKFLRQDSERSLLVLESAEDRGKYDTRMSADERHGSSEVPDDDEQVLTEEVLKTLQLEEPPGADPRRSWVREVEEVFSRAGTPIESSIHSARRLSTASAAATGRRQRRHSSKDVQQFAGVFTVHTLLSKKLDKGKSKRAPKEQQQESLATREKSLLPVFVELYQYPGFDENELTELPEDANLMTVLFRVLTAQAHLKYKPHYRRVFTRIFMSDLLAAILLDTYWWVFLDRFQPHKPTQHKLFARISNSFVDLRLADITPKYKELFLQDMPQVLAQSIYAAYCESFPHSQSQFNDDFKAYLLNLTSLWISGVKSAPLLYRGWNMTALQPKKEKKVEELNLPKDKQTPSPRWFTGSFKQLSTPSIVVTNTVGTEPQKEPVRRTNSPDRSNLPTITVTRESAPTETSASASEEKKKGEEELFMLDNIMGLDLFKKRRHATGTIALQRSRSESRLPKNAHSQPATKGITFNRVLFNIYGNSPLVMHYINSTGAEKKCVPSVLVSRTEIEDVVWPPPDAVTYRELVSKTRRNIKKFSEEIEAIERRKRKDIHKIRAEYKESTKKMTDLREKLLSNRNLMRRYSKDVVLKRKHSTDTDK